MPTYQALLNKIADHYDLSVYAEVPVEKDWLKPDQKYSLRAVTSRKLPRRLREFLFLVFVVKDHLKRPFHLVHAHSTYPTGMVAVIMQKVFGIPAIVGLHAAEGSAFEDIEFGDLLQRKRTIINKWVINRATIVTVLSAFQKNEVVKNLGIKREIIVRSRGVDLDRFYFNPNRELQSPVVFLSVGYLNAIKDPETLLHAFYQIQKEVHSILIVIGKDYTDGALHKLASKLGISSKVKFQGFISHDLINEFYQQADVLLHTSRYESQGMVVAEAMASGVLVVGTDVGIMHDLSGECCITVPTRDPDALAAAVLKLLRDKEMMDTLRKNAHAWSEKNNLDRCCEALMDLYNCQIKGR